MKRLTKVYPSGAYGIDGSIDDAVLRLAAYEDSGIAPEDLQEIFGGEYDLARLREIVPVVHGRWIYGEDVDIQCSVCGADALTEGDYRQIKTRYCPNCGAKMDLED